MQTVRVVTVLVAMLSVLPAQGSVISGLEDYAKDPAKGVISDIQKTGSNLIEQGNNDANGLIVHGGMEIDAATRSAIIGLGGDLDKTVGDLTQGEQEVILSLLNLQNQMKGLTNTAYDLKDTTMVDLTAWESGWVFAHTPDFFVQSIRGTALLPQPGDYHITVTAYGFGTSSDSRADISGTINGNAVQFSEIDQTSQRGQAILAVPNATLAPLFASNKLITVELMLKVKLSRKKFLHTSVNNYQFPIYLLLYPPQVATVTVATTAPTYGWVSIGNVESPVVTTPDTNGCKYCDTSCTSKNNTTVVVPGMHTPPLVGDEKIVSGSLDCRSANLCAYTARTNINIVDNSSRANATWEACTHPAQYVLEAQVQQWKQTGSSSTSATKVLAIDNPQVVTIPDNASLIIINVTSFTKQTYSMVYPQVDPHSVLTANMQAGTSNLVLTAIPPAS